MNTYFTFQRRNVARANGIEEFRDLSATQIKDRVSAMKENTKDLTALIVQPKYTSKLSAIPDLMPDEMYLREVRISYPMANKAGKPKNYIALSGVIHSLEGRKVEVTEGGKFNTKISNAASMADLCRNNLNWNYTSDDNLTLGTSFAMKCEKE